MRVAEGKGCLGTATARANNPIPKYATQAPKPKPAELAAAQAQAAADAGAEAAAAAAAAGRQGVFQLGDGGARVVRAVGTAAPVEDFGSLLAAGQVEDAFGGMQVGPAGC